MDPAPTPPTPHLPLLALTVGDPAGIGPEITAAVLADPRVRQAARIVAIGPEAVRPPDLADFDPAHLDGPCWLATRGPDRWEMGAVQETCGQAALAALRAGAELASGGTVDALVTAPVCKQALHLAGERVEGQTELLTRWAGVAPTGMVAIAGDLRVMPVTRHLPLARAIQGLTAGAVVECAELFHAALRDLGIDRPRLALAALNPHGGEGGALGDEEQRILGPAARRARARGLDLSPPRPADSVFLEARSGRWDGVLALYHDQAFIPLKLCSEGRGLTLIAGLPYLRVSPVHGAAFDIAGRGQASPRNLAHALLWTAERVAQRAGGAARVPARDGSKGPSGAPRGA